MEQAIIPMAKTRVLLAFGTRPEAIKMAPLIHECCRRKATVEPIVCLTGQHREMVDPLIDYFGIRVDVDLRLMSRDQSLCGFAARCLERFDRVLVRYSPDCVVVQGDTTTVLAAGLAAFFRRIALVHLEAGLRTGDLAAPWPEEFNRRVASLAAALHCAPTPRAADALLAEGIDSGSIVVTGNTVVDALLWTLRRERADDRRWREKYAQLMDSRLVLITGHRRENHGAGLRNICDAVGELAATRSDVQFVYPVHLNPNVHAVVHETLAGRRNVHLTPPADYPEFVWLMDRASLILTDSGGIQEEAPSLGTHVLVTRETTERPEAIEAGVAELVGTSRQRIVDRVAAHLSSQRDSATIPLPANPYGDGRAAPRVLDAIIKRFARR